MTSPERNHMKNRPVLAAAFLALVYIGALALALLIPAWLIVQVIAAYTVHGATFPVVFVGLFALWLVWVTLRAFSFDVRMD